MKYFLHRARKIKKPACGPLRVWTKNEEISENVKKIFRNFDQNLYGKLRLYTTFYLKFLQVLHPLRKYIPLEDNQISTTIFPIFWWGWTSPDATTFKWYLFGTMLIISQYALREVWGSIFIIQPHQWVDLELKISIWMWKSTTSSRGN